MKLRGRTTKIVAAARELTKSERVGAIRQVRDWVGLQFELALDESRINEFIQSDDGYKASLEGAGIEDLVVLIREPQLVLQGRFGRSGVKGAFRVDLVPRVRKWRTGEHVIAFVVQGQNIDIDGVVGKTLHVLADATARLFTEDDVATAAIRAKLGDGKGVEVPLDGFHAAGDAVLESLDLLALRCAGTQLIFTLKLMPRQALKNAPLVLSWLKRRVLSE